jgi:HSP20 family protein
MANITRFDPFGAARFDPFGEPFEDVFRRMFRPIRWEGEAAAPEIKVDVEENDRSYVVKAEIPGVKKEDIDVQIDGNVVSISAESKREKKVEEKGKVIRSERYYGSMLRSFSLANDVDQAEATAKYADGILELTLPKKATSAAKKLAVK